MALAAFNTYLIKARQYYDQTEKADRWHLRHAIDQATWDADPYGVTMPDKGDDAPATYPDKLGLGGILLERQIDFVTRPDWVLIDLVYGWDITSVGLNKAYVTGRSVIIQLPIPDKVDGTLIKGDILDADGKITTQFKDITPGYPKEYELCCQLIRLHAFVNSARLSSSAGALQHLGGALNSNPWTVLGTAHAANTMMYRGCEFDVYRHSNVAASRVYVARFDFLIHPFEWPLNVRTTTWEHIVQQVNYYDPDTEVIGLRPIMGRKQITSAATDYPFRQTVNFATALGTLIT